MEAAKKLKEETLQLVNNLVAGGMSKSKIEAEVGMPKNCLSGIISGAKELPDKWIEPLLKFCENPSSELTPNTNTEQEQSYLESLVTDTWRSLLRNFEGIIKDNPPADKIKDKLLLLKESASKSILTVRQIEGIHGRCDNYMNGTYGVDLKKEEYMRNNKPQTATT